MRVNADENLVKYLIKKRIYINKENQWGETPLFKACESGNISLVKYLIEKGTKINQKNDESLTLFFFACKSGNKNLIKYLIEHGVNINEEINKKDKKGNTPLIIVTRKRKNRFGKIFS